jgi:ubiquinone/menaquinone biosynthesis C-methylase UbiE/uncharacterized protein YbaR (Trm112 family)
MNKKSLSALKNLYKKGGNIIEYLKNNNKSKRNTGEMITVSYDLQSGSYIKYVKKNRDFIEKYTKAISKVINDLSVPVDSILEAGVGEATTLADTVLKLNRRPKKVLGFDLAWSRIRYGIEYLKKKGVKNSFLFTGDLFNIPLADNSVDIVYTSHSIEPNGGREKEALLELMRITKKYLILLEPAYEFADTGGRKRMEKHGYIKNLYSSARSLGLRVVEHRLFDICSNPLNPTGLIIIKKDGKNTQTVKNYLECPVTRTPLELLKNSYFSKKGLLAYPIIDGVPCLLAENAIIATHYTDNFKNI